jgi:ABC transport system ATP-binding/permease protein
LEEFLLDFPGCLLVVSHDRYFMDKIVDHLFVFRGQGEVEDFPGNYSDFREYEASTPPDDTVKVASTSNQQQNDANKLSYNEQKEYKGLESKIRALELDKKALEAKFHDDSLSQEAIEKLAGDLQRIIKDLETKETRWFELSEKFGESV